MIQSRSGWCVTEVCHKLLTHQHFFFYFSGCSCDSFSKKNQTHRQRCCGVCVTVSQRLTYLTTLLSRNVQQTEFSKVNLASITAGCVLASHLRYINAAKIGMCCYYLPVRIDMSFCQWCIFPSSISLPSFLLLSSILFCHMTTKRAHVVFTRPA